MNAIIPFNKEKHDRIMTNILVDAYRDFDLGSSIGFKGWTACYFFYGLDRASVDLDFDLTKEPNKDLVVKKMGTILAKYGMVKAATVKRHTIFFLLSYGDTEHNVKIEISTKWPRGTYETVRKNGLSFLVMKKEDMFANKLYALLNRSSFANRDVFDLHFFFRNNWEMNRSLFEKLSGKTFEDGVREAVRTLESLPKNHRILEGIGFLLGSEKQKADVKAHLLEEMLFFLKSANPSAWIDSRFVNVL